MAEQESLQWMHWIEQKRARQKQERLQKKAIEQQENSIEQGPSTTQKIMRSIRNPDRRKRLGGNIY